MNKNKKLTELMNIEKIHMCKLKIKFDVLMLNNIIGFIYKDSVLRTRKVLMNIYKLFNALDMSVYDKDVELADRVWLIKKSLDARIKEGFENDTMIRQYCSDDVECNEHIEHIIENIPKYSKNISHEESKYLIKAIKDRLDFGYTITIKEIIQNILDQIDDGDFKTYKAISEDLYSIASSIINIKRSTSGMNGDELFSLREEEFVNAVTDAVTRLKDRNKILLTGIQRLNTILSPGYLAKRLYVYLAFPGGGKSQILLKSALDMKKYNKVKPKDPNKNPAILFITMENNIDETIERIFNLTVSSDDIRNYTPKQIIKKLKEDGQLELTDDNNTNLIIKYYDNRSIDTNDLYSIIQDLDDDGNEVIALFLDYLKRIKPAEKADSEKTELKNITNELKTLSKHFDIPVISAQQLNRTAASVIDAALQAKKEDVTKLIGRDGIAGAWEINNKQWFPHIAIYVKNNLSNCGELLVA